MNRERAGEREPVAKPVELELQRDVQAPALARSAVSELFGALSLSANTVQTLMLLVSEVVTNAVVHSTGPSGSPIILSAGATEEVVRVTVTDGGSGFTPRQRDPTSIHDGYGLFLLEKAASDWGVEMGGETSVWFELPRCS